MPTTLVFMVWKKTHMNLGRSHNLKEESNVVNVGGFWRLTLLNVTFSSIY